VYADPAHALFAEELSVIATRELRAPRQDGALLAEPPLEAVGALLDRNRQSLDGIDILGLPLEEVRRQARESVVAAAHDYLQRNGEPVPAYGDTSLILAGHQPELFHPGVWVKNFLLNGLARRHGITPVNLVVDDDTVKSTSLRLPVREAEGWRIASVPFDRWQSEEPFEERPVLDEGLFQSVPEWVEPLLHEWDYVPILPELWDAMRRMPTPLLGERFVRGRRLLERRWGCHNLEVPLSAVCRTEAFARFACHVLEQLPRLHALYNGIVRDYRRQNGIRSRNHPVPDLQRDGDWLEAPFWAWHPGQERRGRLFARRTATAIELRVGGETWPALPLSSLVDAWQARPAAWKVRTRALTTTLFARLFLGDLFIHGIGGAKYDELTDELIRRFYGLEPPGFLVLSGTWLLPLKRFPATAVDRQRLHDQLRDVEWNPQRHLLREAPAEARAWAEEKQRWIAEPEGNRRYRRERYRALRSLTEKLRPFLGEREDSLRRDSAACEWQLRQNAVLGRRDYSFCLYPEAMLRWLFQRFLS
jgi:hypothetical protein